MTRQPTPEQQRLNADFEAIFGSHALPAIAPPLTPELMQEGDLTAELC